MLTEICEEIRNYFSEDEDKHFGKYTISGGNIKPLDFMQDGQYFRIVGSAMNDGVYQYPCVGLTDESFDGAVWAMRLPPSLIALSDRIKEYAESEQAKPSAYTSESFGGYSYTKKTDSHGGDGGAWQSVFRKELNKWRKI